MSRLAELVKQLFGGVKDAAQAAMPGLSAEKFVGDVKDESKRLMTQGTMEVASALFNGHGFVPYGPGQYTPSGQEKEGGVHGPPTEKQPPQAEQANEGMSR